MSPESVAEVESHIARVMAHHGHGVCVGSEAECPLRDRLRALALAVEQGAEERATKRERERIAAMLKTYTALDAYEFPQPGYEARKRIEDGATFPGMDELREEIISESYGCGITYLIRFGRGIFHDAVIRAAKHFAKAIEQGGEEER